ncbi:hypothetical protein NI17_011360 [Thermobifida halotolerans]|uniref:Uncharacterized protein n=1 Tax=Thermobifida halotolerans TaxID=483545 RepID=A0AA97M0I7_9ACTN|nr:hypothetical protein [Thermobifida halotolerans]UOE21637.1 hypothetical protein NI17_011360 [Thermobifida halotolerans]
MGIAVSFAVVSILREIRHKSLQRSVERAIETGEPIRRFPWSRELSKVPRTGSVLFPWRGQAVLAKLSIENGRISGRTSEREGDERSNVVGGEFLPTDEIDRMTREKARHTAELVPLVEVRTDWEREKQVVQRVSEELERRLGPVDDVMQEAERLKNSVKVSVGTLKSDDDRLGKAVKSLSEIVSAHPCAGEIGSRTRGGSQDRPERGGGRGENTRGMIGRAQAAARAARRAWGHRGEDGGRSGLGR